MRHIVLAGDSIFDNQPYVKKGVAVIDQLNKKLGRTNKTTLLAIDGDVTQGVANQLLSIPEDATDLFISVGGNDGLLSMSIFNDSVESIGEALIRINSLRITFEKNYTKMVESALNLGLPLTLCTIYYPRFNATSLDRVNSFTGTHSGESVQAMVMSALAMYNDVIFKVALDNHLDIIDLRTLCNEDQDFANPIEPSIFGGDKITDVIIEKVLGLGLDSRRSVIY